MSQSPSPARVPAAALLTIAGLALLVLAALVAWLYQEWRTLVDAAPLVAMAIRLAVFLLILAGPCLAGLIAWRRWGHLESVRARHAAELMRAQTQVAPLASSYHYHHEAHALAAEALPALPAPVDVGPLPAAEWLAWADAQPHALFGGMTKSGKTTTAKALLAGRIMRGETVFVIDPHASDWFGLPVAGASSAEWQALIRREKAADESCELARALMAAFGEYQRRMAMREEYKKRTGRELPAGSFPRLTILIDEANTIAELFPQLWSIFLKLVASGTRKVDIGFLLLAHSPLVEDLKISATMRSNFACIALDDRGAQLLIDQCRDRPRQAALNALLPDQDWPALAAVDGRLSFLGRAGLNLLPEPLNAAAHAWDGWDYQAGRVSAPSGQQDLVSSGALLPNTIGCVRLAWCIAKMVARGKPPAEIAPVVASLVLRAAPDADRTAVEAEVARRAARLSASGNAPAIAAQLDRDALIKLCLDCGAGVMLALQIYGGKRQSFLDAARTLATARAGNDAPGGGGV